MDEIVTLFIAASCLALACAGVSAQTLPDPTRRAPADGASGAVAGTAQLQSVLIGRGTRGRRVAVISGQILRVGDIFEGAVLTSISESEVVLRRGKKLKILKLSAAPAKPPASLEPARGVEQ